MSETASEEKLTTTPIKSTNKTKSERREPQLCELSIGFCGAGKMADSVIKGLISYANIDPKRIYMSANPQLNKKLKEMKEMGCHVLKSNYDIFYDCDIVFLCFHGSVIKLSPDVNSNEEHPFITDYIPLRERPYYVLSLMPGITMDEIRSRLLNPNHPEKYKIEMHRIVLNIGVDFGLGVGAIDVEEEKCSPIIRNLLSSISSLEYIDESDVDFVCSLGSNGLAFTYYYISSLVNTAVKIGISQLMANKFAAKTVECAARVLLYSDKHPEELKAECTSPSGPAIYGIDVLNRARVASGIANAVEAAHQKDQQFLAHYFD